jgi:hypothetical protein
MDVHPYGFLRVVVRYSGRTILELGGVLFTATYDV